MKYKVGDRVLVNICGKKREAIVACYCHSISSVGVVVSGWIGHTLNGEAPSRNGWWVDPKDIQLLLSKETKFQKSLRSYINQELGR